MPGTALSEAEWSSCLQAVEDMDDVSFIIAIGSLPPGVPHDIYAILAKIAKDKRAKFIVDTSGEPLKKAVEQGVYLLKPNLGELSFLAGKDELQKNEIEAAAKLIIQKGMCEVVVVSMGADGAMMVTKNETLIICPPHVERKSTVGAGDSMVAGIVYYLWEGKTIREAVQYGVACDTAATMNTGTELCNKKDVEVLYEVIKKGI